jgi:aldose sugar dehydrogenase
MFLVWNLQDRTLVLALLISLVASGCGSPEGSPSGSSSSNSQSNEVTSRARLGWVQEAASLSALSGLRYAAYVDGSRSELTDVTCAVAAGPSGFECTSRFPPMSRGAHSIELVSFVVDGDAVVESAHSSPLQVNATAAITLTAAGGTDVRADGGTLTTVDQMLTTADHLSLRSELVAEGLEDPTDMAFAPDGRIFVTERAGKVRVVQQDRLRAAPALQLDDVGVADGGGLVAIAIDPQFSNTHLVYTIYTARSRGNNLMFRLARFREVAGTLGERAILLEGIPASQGASASLRFAKDGKLYAAFDDSGDANLRERLSSFNGKILRLNPDASTPADSTAGTPVYAYGFQSPRGLDWQPATGTLWIADRVQNGGAGLHAILSSNVRSSLSAIRRSYALPSADDTTAMVFYQGALLPSFEGNLLMANERGHYILRIRFDANVPPNIVATEPLLQDRVGAVHALGIGQRGEIYFTTDNTLGRIVAP